MNGSISGNLTVFPNIVTFSCDPGFILRGSSIRKCQSNGTWDGYVTTCEGEVPKMFRFSDSFKCFKTTHAKAFLSQAVIKIYFLN